jgi:DNA/RNA-binding domain of Phe-tRNA-synthetase-like protein
MGIPSLSIDSSLDPCPVKTAVVWAYGIQELHHPDNGLPAYLAEAAENFRQKGENQWSPNMKKRVRQMLRHGKYSPSGRGKPASEYICKMAEKNKLPSINHPVDINNAVSLRTGLPGSVFDLAKTGKHLALRRGQADEHYIFNQAGQSIKLQDLLLVCYRRQDAWIPCGNPVKDSMETKIFDACKDVVAVIYAPIDEADQSLEKAGALYHSLLSTHTKPRNAGFFLVLP